MEVVIYPKNVNKDKDKLFACYSLVQQMIDEHNRQGEIARSNPSKYLKTGKFRSYQKQFESSLEQVLAERDRLKGIIRDANYTPKEWKDIGRLNIEQRIAIYESLFGDKAKEKTKLTLAASPILDELKLVRLDALSVGEGIDPTEDFSTYDETDEGNDITKTSTTITAVSADCLGETFHVSDSKGSNHFNADFEHLLEWEVTAIGAGAVTCHWMLANLQVDFHGIFGASGDSLQSYSSRSGNGVNYYIILSEINGGSESAYDLYSNFSLSTDYYPKIKRDDDEGSYGKLYEYIYDDSERTNLVDTLTVVLTEQQDFEFVFGIASYDIGGTATISCTISNLDLQEAVVPTAIRQAATNVGGTTARINGKISDDGGESCEARFRWRPLEAEALYEHYNTGDDDVLYAHDDLWQAHTITPLESHKIKLVKLKLYRTLSPGTITVSIKATDGSGHPTGEDLCSGTTNGNTLTTDTDGEWREITLGDGYNLSEGTKYAIVVRALDGDGSNHVGWRLDGSSPTYTGGNAEYSIDGGSNWLSNNTRDFMFEELGVGEWVITEWQNTLETNDEYYEDLTELDSGTEYEFQTQAKNSAGEGEWSDSEEFETLVGQPTMRRWGGSILPIGAQRIGKGW